MISTTHKKIYTKGFSLVELMVSLTIFSIVMVVSVGTLLVVIDANAKAQALYSVMTNLSFVVDDMSRSMRMGYDHYCTGTLNSPNDPLQTGTRDCAQITDDEIAFTRQVDGVRVGYRFQSDGLGSGWIEERVGTADWLRITSNDVVITSFKPDIQGSTPSDEEQPKITILVEGYVRNGLDTETDFRLQTHVTQRILDY